MVVIVTPRSMSRDGHPALSALEERGWEIRFPARGRRATKEELTAALGDVDGYIAGVEPVTAEVLDAAPNLRVISRNGTGVDSIDVAAAESRGVAVRRAEGANARGVAELTIGHILSAARFIPLSDAELKGHHWQRRLGSELYGKTLGLIGCGKVGRMVAELALAFGMKVRAYDPYPPEDFRPEGDFELTSLADLLLVSDIVSLHCPVPADGSPVLGEQELPRLKEGAVLVNTARAALVDDAAVAAALDSGRLSHYTVDAFAEEPPSEWSLIERSNVTATPHIGGYTAESVDRAARAAVENLIEELER